MIVNVCSRGFSFLGAGKYYLHDKREDKSQTVTTTERVGFIYAHNLQTNGTHRLDVVDAQHALKIMAYTAKNAELLKQQAGVSNRGRRKTLGEVYSYSLSWDNGKSPDEQTMMTAAMDSLKFLNLDKDYQSLFVQHTDTDHDHVHIIVNLISPIDGKVASVGNDRISFSKWSEEYEREHGGIVCEQRVKNNEKRRELAKEKERHMAERRAEKEAERAWEKAEKQKVREAKKNNQVYEEKPFEKWDRDTGIVKHGNQKIDKARIQEIYINAKNTAEFEDLLKTEGYVLARGTRRDVLLIDTYTGKEASLSRQISGLWKRADINQKWRGGLEQRFADFDEKKIPPVREVVDSIIYVDRDKQTQEQNDRIDKAAIEKEKQKLQQEQEQRKRGRLKEKSPLKFEWDLQDQGDVKTHQEIPVNDDSHLVRLDKEQAWDLEAQRRRNLLEKALTDEFNRQSTVDEIKSTIQKIHKSKGKERKELEDKHRILRLNLENMDMRIAERRGALEEELAKTSPYIKEENNVPSEKEQSNVIDLEAVKEQRRVDELKARREKNLNRQHSNKKDQSKDKDLDLTM